MECDLLVLGAGPGGYPAAIRATQLGASVVCVEEKWVGGTCLNVGCIPTKAMVQSAHAWHDLNGQFKTLGVVAENPSIDFDQVQKNRRTIVDNVVKGLGGLMKGLGIQMVSGRGTFTGPNTLQVEGGEEIRFKAAVIATGSRPTRPPIPGIESERCIDSTGMLEVEQIPKRLVILGGGIIGCEFASIFGHLGSEVTIVEMLDHLIANEDADAINALERAFKSRKIAVQLGARATRIEEIDGGVRLVYAGKGDEEASVEADVILVATGRVANVEGFGLEKTGVEAEKRRIPVDSHMRTNVAHIYAVGDVAGNWQLAHTAFREGEVAAENALGHEAEIDYRSTPRPIYTDPEIAAVGLTEKQAREQYGDDVLVGKMPYTAIARAAMYGDRTGFVKVISESRYGELLGVVCVGTQATELVNAGVVGIQAESTVETVGDSIAAHPTLGEAVKEAALVSLGRPIHVPAPKKRPAKAGVA
jgi:dihydrolipoamide dehydrogenase